MYCRVRTHKAITITGGFHFLSASGGGVWLERNGEGWFQTGASDNCHLVQNNTYIRR